MVMQALCCLIKIADESVNVVLFSATIKTGLVQSRIQAGTKLVRLLLDAIDDLFDLFIAYTVGHIRNYGSLVAKSLYGVVLKFMVTYCRGNGIQSD
jgi:hypothetical protein